MECRELFGELYKLKNRQYAIQKGGLPPGVRENIERLCELFESSTNEGRREIISNVVREISFLFLAFSDLMAIDAVRHQDKRLVIRGLEALAIENCIMDWRESTIVLAVLYHSARKIGADPDELIDFVARMAPPDAANKFFRSFASRTAENKLLIHFGIQEGTTPSGEFTYASVY